MSASREQDYITIVRQYNRSIWEGIHALNAMRAEWDALDYSTTLDRGEGPNDGIDAIMIGAVLFDTMGAFEAVLADGHATNMAKLL
jgi:hypothetical protein